MAFSTKTRKILVALLITGWSLALIYYFFQLPAIKHSLKTKQLYYNNRLLMGTFWQVSSPNKQAATIVFSEASRIEQLLSKYIATSEISQLNRLGKLKVSPDTFYIIKKSIEFHDKTFKAFDITVGPLIDLWGFTTQEFQVPTDDKIRDTLKLVGSDKIILHGNDNVVEFKIPGMKIDLGAIAKGYALDCAVKKLKEHGINNCLINAGGQVYALGDKFGKNWKIAIQGRNKLEIIGALELKDKSASTSGNYEQFFLKGGRLYCHIIDPRTGYPANNQITSATVITDKGITADALSTAIFVLDKDSQKQLIKEFPETQIKIY
ncbi:MAG: FAD:protein FMN transferase [Candidatus Omnitrophica bacterium]|nr:FAD:protein FMN transferase [Candidatus Omnitrophota bacterium]